MIVNSSYTLVLIHELLVLKGLVISIDKLSSLHVQKISKGTRTLMAIITVQYQKFVLECYSFTG